MCVSHNIIVLITKTIFSGISLKLVPFSFRPIINLGPSQYMLSWGKKNCLPIWQKWWKKGFLSFSAKIFFGTLLTMYLEGSSTGKHIIPNLELVFFFPFISKNIPLIPLYVLYSYFVCMEFSSNRPLGRFDLVVAMSVPASGTLGLVPFPCDFFRGLSLALRSHDQFEASDWSTLLHYQT